MGGHGHEPPYVVPDYKKFQVKGIKQLEELEKALSAKGLKDPWIRNEVWRYDPGFGTKAKRALGAFRGLPLGLALTVITIGVTKAMGGDDHGHGHGHD